MLKIKPFGELNVPFWAGFVAVAAGLSLIFYGGYKTASVIADAEIARIHAAHAQAELDVQREYASKLEDVQRLHKAWMARGEEVNLSAAQNELTIEKQVRTLLGRINHAIKEDNSDCARTLSTDGLQLYTEALYGE